MSREVDNFRTLIVLSLTTLGAAVYVSIKGAPPPEEYADLYGWRGYGAVTLGPFGLIPWYAELALVVLGLVGMFFFIPLSRLLILISIFLTPLRIAFGGIWVSYPLEDTFWALHWLFFMFVVGMAFFSEPVVRNFRRPASAAPGGPAPNNALEQTRDE